MITYALFLLQLFYPCFNFFDMATLPKYFSTIAALCILVILLIGLWRNFIRNLIFVYRHQNTITNRTPAKGIDLWCEIEFPDNLCNLLGRLGISNPIPIFDSIVL